MTAPAQIYVGTDERMEKAERALENSLRANATTQVEIHWMRSGERGFDDWNMGRPQRRPNCGGGWSTDFTGFRFAVPELAGFQGRAIYLDVDMLVLGDIAELWRREARRPWASPDGRTEVSVIDCTAFAVLEWWPRIAEMKRGARSVDYYTELLRSHGFLDTSLPIAWNSLDRWTPDAKLIHFTNMQTQPWKPWPEVISYTGHADKRAEALFWRYYEGVQYSHPRGSDR